MSDSMNPTSTAPKTDGQIPPGLTQPNKFKVKPLTPDDYRPGPTTSTVGMNGHHSASNGNGRSSGAVPEDAGARIPIEIRPQNGANGASATATTQEQVSRAMPASVRASIPDVMGSEAEPEESVEEMVNRLRPRSIRMQIRFLYTVFFSVWLFGRLVFWQVYVAKLFPNWVLNSSKKRWAGYAKEFRHFAIRMGGVMIKAGQFASTRADILPEMVIEELAGLQDKVPTIPFKKIADVLRDELGDLDKRYSEVVEEPIAAASLGQVHRATLQNGDAVVVKIQRPNVRKIVYTDMAALFIVAKIAMRFSFVSRRVDAPLIVDEFGRVLLEEVSYEKEAENAERFRDMFREDEGVYVPHIYREHSTDKILTIEDVTSIKIDDYERLAAAGIRREDVAQRLMDTYMQQIFEDRFFHADPHPGNLFVYPLPVDDEQQYIGVGGRPFYLIFIDFGMTGTLTREIVQGLINTLTAVITRDSRRLVASYVDLGFLLPSADLRRLEEATQIVFDQVWGLSMYDMQTMDYEVAANIGEEFVDLLYDMPFRLPQDFVYLGRTVSILSGMATKLDPQFNPWNEIQNNVQKLITTDEENNIFDELGKVIQQAVNEVVEGGPQGAVRVVQRFLNQFQRINRTERMLQRLIDGEVMIETKMSPQEKRQLQKIELQGKRTSRMFIVGAVLICSTLLYTSGETTLAYIGFGVTAFLYVGGWFIRA